VNRMGVCSRCGEAAKYRCPGCELVTCSLACIKEHKAALGCCGKRARTDFVDIHDLGDRHLISGTFPRTRAVPVRVECGLHPAFALRRTCRRWPDLPLFARCSRRPLRGDDARVYTRRYAWRQPGLGWVGGGVP
jgi:hypothetical protein